MDQIRLTGIFDLSKSKATERTPAVVVGAGALGSVVALQLSKIGVPFVVYDDDVVESHNLPNQCLYGPDDVGANKAVALVDRLRQVSDTRVGACPRRLNKPRFEATPYVFVCVDNMASRRAFAENYLPCEGGAFLDGRMGARDAISFLLDRSKEWQRTNYIGGLFDDDDANVERAACGATLSVGATAQIVASQMIWQFMNFVMGRPTPNTVVTSVGEEWGMHSVTWQE